MEPRFEPEGAKEWLYLYPLPVKTKSEDKNKSWTPLKATLYNIPLDYNLG